MSILENYYWDSLSLNLESVSPNRDDLVFSNCRAALSVCFQERDRDFDCLEDFKSFLAQVVGRVFGQKNGSLESFLYLGSGFGSKEFGKFVNIVFDAMKEIDENGISTCIYRKDGDSSLQKEEKLLEQVNNSLKPSFTYRNNNLDALAKDIKLNEALEGIKKKIAVQDSDHILIAKIKKVLKHLQELKSTTTDNQELQKFIFKVSERITNKALQDSLKSIEDKAVIVEEDFYKHLYGEKLKVIESFADLLQVQEYQEDLFMAFYRHSYRELTMYIEYQIRAGCTESTEDRFEFEFRDYSDEISVILSSYFAMRARLQLPQIMRSSEVKAYRNFFQWQYDYLKQCGAWSIGTLDVARYSLNREIKETYLDENNTLRPDHDLRKLHSSLQGKIPLRDLTVFSLERSVLHESIVHLVSTYQMKNEVHLRNLVHRVMKQYDRLAKEQNFAEKLEKQVELYEKQYEKMLSEGVFFQSESYSYDSVKRMHQVYEKYSRMIDNNPNCLRTIVVDELTRGYIYDFSKEIVSQLIQDVIPKNLSKLTQRSNPERLSFLIAGGPASGKSVLVAMVERYLGKSKRDVAILNPDYYKELLVDPLLRDDEIKNDSGLTHEESSIITRKIMNRIIKKSSDGKCPDILFDAARPTGNKLSIANFKNASVNLYLVTCNIVLAIRRAFERGRTAGRFMPTKGLLQAHRDVSTKLPLVLSENNCLFELYCSEVKPGEDYILVASIPDRSQSMSVFNTFQWFEFLEKAVLNADARSPIEIYAHLLMEDRLLILVEQLHRYLQLGISFRFFGSDKSSKVCPLAYSTRGQFSIYDFEGYFKEFIEHDKDRLTFLRCIHKAGYEIYIFEKVYGRKRFFWGLNEESPSTNSMGFDFDVSL